MRGLRSISPFQKNIPSIGKSCLSDCRNLNKQTRVINGHHGIIEVLPDLTPLEIAAKKKKKNLDIKIENINTPVARIAVYHPVPRPSSITSHVTCVRPARQAASGTG